MSCPSASEALLQIPDCLAAAARPENGRLAQPMNSERSWRSCTLALGADDPLRRLAVLEDEQVGMLMTSKRRAVSGLSSTLSLATVSLPRCSSAISASVGATILHGPHHSAQKSTRTGVSDPLTALVERRVGENDNIVGHCGSFRRSVESTDRSGCWNRRASADIPSSRVVARRQLAACACSLSQRSASIAAMQPLPAAVIACGTHDPARRRPRTRRRSTCESNRQR